MTHTQRQKLLNKLSDLEKLRRLYRKHAEHALGCIQKCDAQIREINLQLANDEHQI